MTDISIIVPTLNRARVLFQTLKSIAAIVDLADTVEVIVVDNGSTDQTASVIREIKETYPRCEWRYFYEPMPGLLSGRHLGAKEARGTILAYLDDDVMLAPSWLEALREGFKDPNIALLGGPSMPCYECKPPLWLDGLWVEFEQGRWLGLLSLIDQGSSIKPTDPGYILGLNFAIRKSVFESCGGFHPDCIPKALQRYQGDGETGLTRKIKTGGLAALYHPGAAVGHLISPMRLTIESLEQRGFYQGVCDSYTVIRRERLPQDLWVEAEAEQDKRRDHDALDDMLANVRRIESAGGTRIADGDSKIWKARLRPMKRKLERQFLLRWGDVESVRKVVARAHHGGFLFHHKEVLNDPRLLNWILKSDYFDYSLPEGWQNYWGQNGNCSRYASNP